MQQQRSAKSGQSYIVFLLDVLCIGSGIGCVLCIGISKKQPRVNTPVPGIDLQ